MNTIRFMRALVATNFKAALALRGAFWLQVLFMALNNAIFFVFWWIFFERFESIRGWRLDDMAALFGFTAIAVGLCVVVLGGVRELAVQIEDGQLDPLLTQPKSVLLQAIGSRTMSSGWGDIASGVLFLIVSGRVTVEMVPLVAVLVVSSAVLFCATGVIFQSLAFWIPRVEFLARQLWDFTITFSLYPSPIFDGAVRLILFSLIPAGFISHLPIELILEFRWEGLAVVLAASGSYGMLAIWVFSRGLRRYESGNRITARV